MPGRRLSPTADASQGVGGSIAWWVQRWSTASERCGRQASAIAAAACGGEPAERLAQHEVTGEEDVGVAQGPKRHEVGGPRPDPRKREQGGPDR